jgi:hypothetical protein
VPCLWVCLLALQTSVRSSQYPNGSRLAMLSPEPKPQESESSRDTDTPTSPLTMRQLTLITNPLQPLARDLSRIYTVLQSAFAAVNYQPSPITAQYNRLLYEQATNAHLNDFTLAPKTVPGHARGPYAHRRITRQEPGQGLGLLHHPSQLH